MNIFLTQLKDRIKFKYSCFDRVIVRGYIRSLFVIGNLINFLRAMGFRSVSNGVMRIFTDQLNAHISKEALKYSIPIVWCRSAEIGKNGDKLSYVEKNFTSKHKNKLRNHVYCILTDSEVTQTFITRNLTSKKDKKYEKVYKGNKLVKHYYIYFHDQLLGGPCRLKISSYFPFQAEFYFNGHNALKLALDREGIGYRMKDNAFLWVEDEKAVARIARSLEGKHVQERITYWMGRFFKFDKGKYSTSSKYLHHDWYLTQVEVCSNVIFKSPKFCTNLFERLLDKFSRIGLPDSLSRVYGKKRKPSETRSVMRLYKTLACVKHWFRGNGIKQYNKNGNYIRTETTINRPKSLGLEKALVHLRAYFGFGIGCNSRLLGCCADVDIASIADEDFDKLNYYVKDEKGRKIAALDMRKERQSALFKELLKPKYSVYYFRTKDMAGLLSENYRNPTQIRYELTKLRARKLVEKKKSQSLWIVTPLGYKVLFVRLVSNLHFENPLITSIYRNLESTDLSNPSNLEQAYRMIKDGLSIITRELNMKKVS